MEGCIRDVLKIILFAIPANVLAVDLEALEQLSGSSGVKIESMQKKDYCEPTQKASAGFEWPEDTDFCSWDEQLNLHRMGLYRSLEGEVKALPYSKNSPQSVNGVVVPVLDYDPAGNSHASPVVIDIESIPLEDLALPGESQPTVKHENRGADRIQVEKQEKVFGCADFATFSSRGSAGYPENSLLGLEGALKEGHSGVVIDVRKLRDGAWVVHRDLDVGRATYGSSARVSGMFSYQWKQVFLKDREGNETQIRAPFLEDLLDSFKNNASPSQVLNIEIKEDFKPYSCADLVRLDQAVSKRLDSSQYLYSSGVLEDLACLRSEDTSRYLGYIIDPYPTALRKKTDKDNVGKTYSIDNARNAISARITKVFGIGAEGSQRKKEVRSSEEERWRPKNNRTILNKSNYTDLYSLVGPNYGLHVDYRDFVLMASKKGPELPRLVVYRIGEDKGLRDMLTNQINNHEVMPDGVVVDDSSKRFCGRGEGF
jgi:glycerophosphoryl diester phosphodiesterase